MRFSIFFGLATLLLNTPFASVGVTEELRTNAAVFTNPPAWLTQGRVYKVVDQVQRKLEWDIRRVKVNWINDQAEFQKLHGYDESVLAFSKKANSQITLGPRVVKENFDQVFGHELVHIILYQKYKDAIPKWLEEGLSNYVAKQGKVDYKWLSSQPAVPARSLVHPFIKSSVSSRYHYMASTALIEMIAAKCSLSDLLQLSVGVGLEKYLSTYCEIKNIDADFQKWLKKKG